MHGNLKKKHSGIFLGIDIIVMNMYMHALSGIQICIIVQSYDYNIISTHCYKFKPWINIKQTEYLTKSCWYRYMYTSI